MDKKGSTDNTSGREKEHSKKTNVDCDDSKTTSHTQFFQRVKSTKGYKKITTDEYFGDSESISGSSNTFGCMHGPQGKQYTETKKLKRNFIKELDPLQVDRNWTDKCPSAGGWGMAETLEFLVIDPVGRDYTDRLEIHLRDFARTSRSGFKIDVLNSLCVVLDYLVENIHEKPNLREGTVLLMKNMDKPIFLPVASDITTQFITLQHYLGFLGYLLLRMEDDELFDLVSRGLLWQLSPGGRDAGAVSLRHALGAAACPALYRATVHQLPVASSHRFPTFLHIALLLAAASRDNCIEMIKENIIENIFYRFNPYFPEKCLPSYEMNPVDPQDQNLKLGDSSIHMSTTLSLLLILLDSMKTFLDENAHYHRLLPSPDYYSQRCFIWAYRYECRVREHRHERITLTALTQALLHCYRDRLTAFSTLLMPDIMTLSVLTEIPQKINWTRSVNFNTAQADVQFKKMLIYLSVAFLKVYPSNRFMVESQHWLLGLMFLLDPELCHLRARWSSALFSEIRKTALQALVCTLPLMKYTLIQEYGLIRRLMWYVEWYCETPYELPVLYWCVRLLQVATSDRDSPVRLHSIRDLFDTHGVIILMHLSYTLLEQQCPPVERAQVVLALALRLLTSAAGQQARLRCCVYPQLTWPASGNSLSRTMLDVALFALDKHYIVSDRWLISLLNFIWEAIIWKKEYIQKFIFRNGVFNLLDLITMSSASVQCVALAVLCESLRGARAVAQVIAWRAPQGATTANPNVVKRGGTVASLIASVCRDECVRNGVSLDQNGVIQNLDCPLFCTQKRSVPGRQTTVFELAGSRMSKVTTELELILNVSLKIEESPKDVYTIVWNVVVYHKQSGKDNDNEIFKQRPKYRIFNNPCLVIQKTDSESDSSSDESSCSLRAVQCIALVVQAFTIFHLLSEDLACKVSMADESFNSYKNIILAPEEETILILCSHYLTLKVNETWMETKMQIRNLLPQDEDSLNEYNEISRGWAKVIKRQQEDVLERHGRKEAAEERSLYSLVGRARLGVALDALRHVRCAARSATATPAPAPAAAPISTAAISTYRQPLDDQNVTGQYVRVRSIQKEHSLSKKLLSQDNLL